jgi:1-acyl-sn-glycerol-3-phosphate acyltransferase
LSDSRAENDGDEKLPPAVRGILRKLGDNAFVKSWTESTSSQLEQPARQFDPGFMKSLLGYMKIWNRYFDSEVRGMDRVPEGAVLLVGNHSGGVLTPDTAAVYEAWYAARGMDDPLLGLAFDAVFGIPRARDLMRKIGQMPASMKNAEAAINDGHSVLVYPGGSHEVFRPFPERNRIDLAGRKGFIRLALRTGTPIVPVVGHGGHETTLVLTRGQRFGRLLGMRESMRFEGWPLLLQFPWGISTPALLGVPLPAKITVQVCEPLDYSELGPEAADDEAVVDRCYQEVSQVMQGTLSMLAMENPKPLQSRLSKLSNMFR